MKARNNKGKVHPSSSLSSTFHSPTDDIFPVLKLLPADSIIIVSVLSFQDREVLAFMVTRSLKLADPSFQFDGNNKNVDEIKPSLETQHKPPVFDCDCFNCYKSYWYKWDSSSNRELIHQAIEAFEEHLNNDEQLKKPKKCKTGRRECAVVSPGKSPDAVEIEEIEKEFVHVLPEEAEAMSPEKAVRKSDEKGMLGKVFPDIMGLKNCRFWGLWSPNM